MKTLRRVKGYNGILITSVLRKRIKEKTIKTLNVKMGLKPNKTIFLILKKP
jgi:hypothetical protein